MSPRIDSETEGKEDQELDDGPATNVPARTAASPSRMPTNRTISPTTKGTSAMA